MNWTIIVKLLLILSLSLGCTTKIVKNDRSVIKGKVIDSDNININFITKNKKKLKIPRTEIKGISHPKGFFIWGGISTALGALTVTTLGVCNRRSNDCMTSKFFNNLGTILLASGFGLMIPGAILYYKSYNLTNFPFKTSKGFTFLTPILKISKYNKGLGGKLNFIF